MTNASSENTNKPASIILCGGNERRFGRSKAMACVGGLTVIDRVLRVLEPLSSRIVVVTSPEKRGMPVGSKAVVITDKYPGKGPLGGIYTGLLHADTQMAIVVACDMPFLNPALLDYMLKVADGFDAVVPRVDAEMVEPLHAIYARSCLNKMQARIESGHLSIAPVLEQLRVRYITKEEYFRLDPRMLSFFNINYPEDFERANEIAAQLDTPDRSSNMENAPCPEGPGT